MGQDHADPFPGVDLARRRGVQVVAVPHPRDRRVAGIDAMRRRRSENSGRPGRRAAYFSYWIATDHSSGRGSCAGVTAVARERGTGTWRAKLALAQALA